MKWSSYVKDYLGIIALNLFLMVILTLFLLSVGNTLDTIFLIIIVWVGILFLTLFITYKNRKKRTERLLEQLNQLDEKYLIAEIMDCPEKSVDTVYYFVIKSAFKSMIEKVSESKRQQYEYRNYIEQWLHEVKTPLSALKILCETSKSDLTRKMLPELEKINHYSEQAMYYARSENPEKDYLIKEILLSEIIHKSISDNKQLLLNENIQIQIEGCEETVYTDEKWICFILNQLITNSVKYKNNKPKIIFKSVIESDRVLLNIIDNGIGICESELPRVFEKGFTGTNGRQERASTGIGLFLCKRLCDKLGIGIDIESNAIGTTITMTFYKNNFIRVQDS